MKNKLAYNEAIRAAIYHLLKKDKNFHVLGQGVTSPWYAGGSLLNLNKEFPKRVLETPISENLITGMGAGASMLGVNCLIFHPRMDFMLYACDSIINQIAKWNYVTGGEVNLPVTIRGVINRGGSQGAQHSQSLHSFFGHIPGLRVVMPYSPKDAHDLLIASVKCKDPVIYIDDRWLYDTQEYFVPDYDLDLKKVKPKVLRKGSDITLVSSSFSTHIAIKASELLSKEKIFPEVIDLRVTTPLNINLILNSLYKTKKLLVIDGGHEHCGYANSLIGAVMKKINIKMMLKSPQAITLPNSPAPSSKNLEEYYYPSSLNIVRKIRKILNSK